MARGAGRAPAAIRTCRPSRTASPTRTVAGPVNRARPWNATIPALAKASSRWRGTGSVNVRLKRISADHSIRAPSDRTPQPSMTRARSMTSAAPTSTFFGSQPRRTQVPPKGRESTIATRQPARRQREATVDAADPVPITTRSNASAMSGLLALATSRQGLFPDGNPYRSTAYTRIGVPPTHLGGDVLTAGWVYRHFN